MPLVLLADSVAISTAGTASASAPIADAVGLVDPLRAGRTRHQFAPWSRHLMVTNGGVRSRSWHPFMSTGGEGHDAAASGARPIGLGRDELNGKFQLKGP